MGLVFPAYQGIGIELADQRGGAAIVGPPKVVARVAVLKRGGFVATFLLMGISLGFSPDREVEERWHDRLQGQSI
jgi:hypothetical protein